MDSIDLYVEILCRTEWFVCLILLEQTTVNNKQTETDINNHKGESTSQILPTLQDWRDSS